jgi:membrane protein DedA with SNARE-associated domain
VITLDQVAKFLSLHGYSVLFLAVFAEQIGLPLPALPILLGAGALASAGHMDYMSVILLALVATLASDIIWYEIGRRRGASILGLLCRVSLEPDSCVRKTGSLFARHGARSLVIAKFVPGLNTAAPPMAGVQRMGYFRFLFFDGVGALLWIVVFTTLGYLCSDQLEQVMSRATALGGSLAAVIVAVLAVFVLWKYFQRRRVLRETIIERVPATQLARALESDEPPVVVDLREPLEQASDPVTIPGALLIPWGGFEARLAEIPVGKDVILFCT